MAKRVELPHDGKRKFLELTEGDYLFIIVGDFIKKSMKNRIGKEICMEWLYHIGVPEEQITPSLKTVPTPCPP